MKTCPEIRVLTGEWKEALAERFLLRTHRHLVWCAVGRFDQQTTTKFHLDGGPDESFLLLAYEPSQVRSRLAFADYTRAAADLQMTPKEFLDQFNPMFAAGRSKILPYITTLEPLDTETAYLVVVNNCRVPFEPGGENQLGVLHQASVLDPDPAKSRVIHSMLLGTADDPNDESASLAGQCEANAAGASQ